MRYWIRLIVFGLSVLLVRHHGGDRFVYVSSFAGVSASRLA